MFGLKNAQEIYHEILFRLAIKDKQGIISFISKTAKEVSILSEKIATVEKIIESLIKEKELFLNVAKGFNDFRFIVIDDLERMNKNIKLEEVFGIIDELKRCNYIKIILVANTAEMSQKELFDKYSEKVIDRTYLITECPEKVDWTKLGIHDGFITEFLSRHHVKNLRTLQKAQNFYEDVRLKLKDGYKDEFYNEIRLACYAIVVETIDNLYYEEIHNKQNNDKSSIFRKISNELRHRINIHYLHGIKMSSNMIDILQEYYKNEIDITANEIDIEYQIFIHAGEKSNYFKSDNEIKQLLPSLEEKLKQETNIIKIVRYAEEYFIWTEVLQLDAEVLKNEYKAKLTNMIYNEVMNGVTEYLTYGTDILDIQSQTNNCILKEVAETVKNKVITEYIRYLSENTYGAQAFQYSYSLKKFVNATFFQDAISDNIDALYNEKSFPIHNVTRQKYQTSYNIMYVLYHENKDRFLDYCNELKTRCDNMSAHRINTLLKEITGNK